MKTSKTYHLLNEQNLMTRNSPGQFPTSFMVLCCLHHFLNLLSYLNSMLSIQKELNDLSSTLPAVLNSQTRNGPMFSQDVLSILMLCSPDITQHPITTNELKKSGISKFASEQSIQQKLSLLPESGVLHGISHHGLYVQPSHTELASLCNMLSTSLGYLLQPMYIFTIVLSFLTRLFASMLVLVETWSSLTSTSFLTLDRPAWIQLVLLSSNEHPLLP